jgi:hypothetical protein
MSLKYLNAKQRGTDVLLHKNYTVMNFSSKEKFRHFDKAQNSGLKLPMTVASLSPNHPPLP